jgi:uncharacterized protein YjiK
MFGSASTSRREKVFLSSFTTSTTPKVQVIKTGKFFKRVSKAGIKDVNIEGLAAVNNTLLLANRGNNKNRYNHLISTSTDFFNNQEVVSFKVLKMIFEGVKNEFAGISGLAYIPSKDMLIFTASTEDTDNTVDDGAIGNSYLGTCQ